MNDEQEAQDDINTETETALLAVIREQVAFMEMQHEALVNIVSWQQDQLNRAYWTLMRQGREER